VQAVPFRFNGGNVHEYIALDTGEELPHVTGMLEATGWVDSTWMTEASCERGRAVHALASDYDLGAIEDVTQVDSRYAAYLHAHAQAMRIIQPVILAVEEPLVHPTFRFAGRIDRHAITYGLQSVIEIKSGAPLKGHPIQLALQAFLLEPTVNVPADAIARFALYLKPTGRFRLERFDKRTDVDKARRIIKQTCGR
jgi:hypothetical protein